jgi:hypothetical protein
VLKTSFCKMPIIVRLIQVVLSVIYSQYLNYGFTTSNSRINDKLERRSEKVTVTYSKYYPRISARIEENSDKPRLEYSGSLSKFQPINSRKQMYSLTVTPS